MNRHTHAHSTIVNVNAPIIRKYSKIRKQKWNRRKFGVEKEFPSLFTDHIFVLFRNDSRRMNNRIDNKTPGFYSL